MKNATICLLWCVVLATLAAHAESANADGSDDGVYNTYFAVFDSQIFIDVLLKGPLLGLQPTIGEVGIYGDIEAGIEKDDF
ncbi:hypothetical protein [Pseudomonas sp. S09G 359]|jgi:hypothetical protein|uniref:hypothetical protein n=1 Tax=Pseudomonas sp. S09G 359 TaxID=2054919 RepID=UPI000C6C8F47|nr:hypothetical protein [Pseudomonas sp. S09G 359]AUG07457.1 hypothetical protein CXQ82_12995 [Pseudomonas sp. S09G 359]